MEERKRTRITKKLIAERLGLSTSTVDRALNHRGNVKPETYRKILQVAQDMNYTVNQSAKFLSNRVDVHVAVVIPSYPERFWGQVEKGIWNAYEELRDYGLTVDFLRISDDVNESIQSIQSMIDSNHYNAFAFAVGDDGYTHMIDGLMDSGIPVATFNVDSPTSKRLFYVGCDYHQAGRLAGDLMARLLRNDGNVALVTDSWVSLQAKQKISGFRQVMASYPMIKFMGPYKVDRDNPKSALENLEDELRLADGIYVSNAELLPFADLGLRLDVVLIGHDLNEDSKRLIENDVLTATICQEPERQGYLTIRELFRYAAFNKEVTRSENLTKLEIVMKENVQFYS